MIPKELIIIILGCVVMGLIMYREDYKRKKEQQSYWKNQKGFNYKGQFITNPFISPCGRFDVNPKKYYGLTEEQAKQYREEKNNGTI